MCVRRTRKPPVSECQRPHSAPLRDLSPGSASGAAALLFAVLAFHFSPSAPLGPRPPRSPLPPSALDTLMASSNGRRLGVGESEREDKSPLPLLCAIIYFYKGEEAEGQEGGRVKISSAGLRWSCCTTGSIMHPRMGLQPCACSWCSPTHACTYANCTRLCRVFIFKLRK